MAGRRGAWRRGLLTWLSTLLQQFKFRWAADHTEIRCCSVIIGKSQPAGLDLVKVPRWPHSRRVAYGHGSACLNGMASEREISDMGLQEATGAVDAAFFIQRHAG